MGLCSEQRRKGAADERGREERGEIGVGVERLASTRALVRTATGGLAPVRGGTPVGSVLFSAGSRGLGVSGRGGGWKRCTLNVKGKESDIITCRYKNTGLFYRNRCGVYG